MSTVRADADMSSDSPLAARYGATPQCYLLRLSVTRVTIIAAAAEVTMAATLLPVKIRVGIAEERIRLVPAKMYRPAKTTRSQIGM